MSTALFKLVWNAQKSTCTIFFKYQGKMFLNTENVLMFLNTENVLMFLNTENVLMS